MDLSEVENLEESYDANPLPQDESSLAEPVLEQEPFELRWEVMEGATE